MAMKVATVPPSFMTAWPTCTSSHARSPTQWHPISRRVARSKASLVMPSRSPMMAPRALSRNDARSEEHTSELQSQSNLVCRLLLEKKKNFNAGSCRVVAYFLHLKTYKLNVAREEY